MNRRRYLRIAGIAAFGGVAGCAGRNDPRTIDGIDVPGRIGRGGFEVPRGNEKGWRELLVRGVNMGITKPGYFPGETAITREEYGRWFRQIGAMNANAIRVYTIHPPGFYEALATYNRRADDPLYLFHGNWLTEEVLAAAGDAYDTEVTTMYEQSIRRTIDLLHGNATIPDRPGHAGGTYEVDISSYVLGYIVGIEWDPAFVIGTNEAHPTNDEFDGRYVTTSGASPFERWIAERLDFTAAYEMDNYDAQHPLSFTNWVTTDLLDHPAEPFVDEDAVSVNPNHLSVTDAHHPGMFASYHVYPYYPDFLNYERRYVEYVDESGEKSSYAGYLDHLVSANDYPVLVAEFGVPASRGKTHSQVYGKDQGHHTETEQGRIDADLFRAIVNAGTAGGLVFAWQDEWFKRTWNTMDYSNPDRRPYWSDYQTCEQYFGLLSFDPGEELAITLSGTPKEWTDCAQLYERRDRSRGWGETSGSERGERQVLEGMRAAADERYLYIRVDYADLETAWDRHRTAILLDTTPDRGVTALSADETLRSERGIDFLALFGGQATSRVLVDSHYDRFYYQYGEGLDLVPNVEYAAEPDNGVFHPIRLALNNELFIPSQNRTIPFESYETGRLRRGIGDPGSKRYDSLADFHVSFAENTVELRLPWLLLNFRDPSTREITGDIWTEGLAVSETIDDIGIGAVTFEAPDRGRASPSGPAFSADSRVIDSFPVRRGGTLPASGIARFGLDAWQEPKYHERLKQSYYVLQRAFEDYGQ